MLHAQKKIVLHAGDYCFDRSGTHIHTLLGSCISITLWHPRLKIGGMCHFALPECPVGQQSKGLDPRYGNDCMKLFLRSAVRHRTKITDYQAKIFGGGNMYEKVSSNLTDMEERLPVGEKNSVAAFHLLTMNGVDILTAHVGEFGYRRIIFDISTGDVWVKFNASKNSVGDQRSLSGRS